MPMVKEMQRRRIGGQSKRRDTSIGIQTSRMQGKNYFEGKQPSGLDNKEAG